MYHFIFAIKLSLFSKSVAFVQTSLSFTQVFVFYFINNLCSVELLNKNINIFIKVTETRVFVIYPMLVVYQYRYDRLAVQFCLRVTRSNPCYA